MSTIFQCVFNYLCCIRGRYLFSISSLFPFLFFSTFFLQLSAFRLFFLSVITVALQGLINFLIFQHKHSEGTFVPTATDAQFLFSFIISFQDDAAHVQIQLSSCSITRTFLVISQFLWFWTKERLRQDFIYIFFIFLLYRSIL